MSDIVVVGDAGLDVLASHTGGVPNGGDNRAVVRTAIGGAGANTAIWLAELGNAPTLVARIGADLAGSQVRQRLDESGVRPVLSTDATAATCCVVALIDESGERSMLADRGASALLDAAEVTPAILAEARHLHLSGYVLLDPRSRRAGAEILRAARGAGLTTSVDPQAAALIQDASEFLEWVDGIDLLLPNEAELRALTGSAEPEHARALLVRVGAVVLTRGAAGACWIGPDGIVAVPAPSVTCVDSTGAGDAFDAGLLDALAGEADSHSALLAAVEVGSRAITHVGAQPLRTPATRTR
ncbi:MAG: carbohydrate kinase family protein [Sciscionella sp.]